MDYLETLKKYFGYDTFRGIQLDIIKSIHNGNDTLGLMPTGGGKSLTFQIPALMMDGICIVVTPLIALMKDQVFHLKQRGIKAEAIYSGLTHREIDRVLDNAIYGAVKFLYVSPERLQTKAFLTKLLYMKVCFITVDEAHCISQWGYDFRPSYLQIAKIREMMTVPTPILALTATATPTVVKDIKEKLQFGKFSPNTDRKTSATFRMSFQRPNLTYVVRRTDATLMETIHILNSVPGSAIVYVRKREKTKKVAEELNAAGIKTTFYHAGLDVAIKDTRQQEWQLNVWRVMVATCAFGMGIDKPDVRLVIHMDCPDSLEEYFQEAGRAGRDGKRAYAVLIAETALDRSFITLQNIAFPAKDEIRLVYDHLAYFFQLAEYSGKDACFEFDINLFCYKFHHFPPNVTSALGILQNAGYIEYIPEQDSSARVMFTIMRHELYEVSGLSALENDILNTLLRCYGSLFAELTFINEKEMEHFSGYDANHIHVALKSLAQKHIIRYIPKRAMPLIRYTQQRIDSSRLRIPHTVYEDLRDKMEERMKAVHSYITNDSECRVAFLLRYFGEDLAEDCQHCDICLAKKKTNTQDAIALAMKILSDGKRHSFMEILCDNLTQKEKNEVIEWLRNDPRIVIKGNIIIIEE